MFTGLKTRNLVIFVLCFAISVAIGITVADGSSAAFDTEVQSIIFEQGREGAVAAMYIMLSHLFDSLIVMAACVFLLVWKKTRFTYGLPITFATVISVIIQKAVKWNMNIPRPDESLWLISQHGSSFPSGHTLAATAFLGMLLKLLYYYRRTNGAGLRFYESQKQPAFYITSIGKMWIVSLSLILLIYMIGFSRVYVGVHWPTDVVAGWFMSCALLALL